METGGWWWLIRNRRAGACRRSGGWLFVKSAGCGKQVVGRQMGGWLERSVAISGEGGVDGGCQQSLSTAAVSFDGGGGFLTVAGGFRRWGFLAFVSAGDVAGVPCLFGDQRGKGGGCAGLLTWAV